MHNYGNIWSGEPPPKEQHMGKNRKEKCNRLQKAQQDRNEKESRKSPSRGILQLTAEFQRQKLVACCSWFCHRGQEPCQNRLSSPAPRASSGVSSRLFCFPAFPARCSFTLLQSVLLQVLGTALPIRNAAFPISCANRDDALPAQQIPSLRATFCFSQQPEICHFCGFLPFPGN